MAWRLQSPKWQGEFSQWKDTSLSIEMIETKSDMKVLLTEVIEVKLENEKLKTEVLAINQSCVALNQYL